MKMPPLTQFSCFFNIRYNSAFYLYQNLALEHVEELLETLYLGAAGITLTNRQKQQVMLLISGLAYLAAYHIVYQL